MIRTESGIYTQSYLIKVQFYLNFRKKIVGVCTNYWKSKVATIQTILCLNKVKTCCYDPLYLPTCSVPQQYTVTHHFYFLTQQASYKAKCKCSLSKLNRKRMWKTKYLQNYYLTVILFKGTQCIVQNLMI